MEGSGGLISVKIMICPALYLVKTAHIVGDLLNGLSMSFWNYYHGIF